MRAFIFDDAGTGKTKRSLDIMCELGAQNVLIICPANVIPSSWLPQVKQWTGKNCATVKDLQNGKWDESFPYMAVSYNSVGKIISVPDNFSLIIDEAHFVKNPHSQRSKLVRTLSHIANNVLMLTGTPAPQSCEDLYGELQVMYPQKNDRIRRFGASYASLTAFRQQYGTPSSLYVRGQHITKWEYSKQAANKVHECMSRDVLARRTSLYEQPHPTWVPCLKPQEEQDAITRWENKWKLTDTVYADDASVVANKIAQLDDGFAYDDHKKPYWFGNSKITTMLEESIRLSMRGDSTPLLVWTRYKAVLDKLKNNQNVQTAREYLTNPQKNVSIVVANPQSMGTGVDGLQKLIHNQLWLDLPWTYADWYQANARLIRRGTLWDDWRIMIVDSKWNRKVWNVIQQRCTLDQIVKNGEDIVNTPPIYNSFNF